MDLFLEQEALLDHERLLQDWIDHRVAFTPDHRRRLHDLVDWHALYHDVITTERLCDQLLMLFHMGGDVNTPGFDRLFGDSCALCDQRQGRIILGRRLNGHVRLRAAGDDGYEEGGRRPPLLARPLLGRRLGVRLGGALVGLGRVAVGFRGVLGGRGGVALAVMLGGGLVRLGRLLVMFGGFGMSGLRTRSSPSEARLLRAWV